MSDPKLKHTKNYKLFYSNRLQRSIDHAHVRKLVKSMQEFEFFPSMPITVHTQNGQHEIVDGHHRYLAAKEAGEPVWFVEATSEGETMTRINSLQRTWSLQNWLQHYVRARRKHYVRLYQLLEEHKVSISIAIGLLSSVSAAGGSDTKAFKEGRFTIKSEALFNTVIEFRDWLKPYNKSASSGRMINAFCLVLNTPDFSLERLKNGIEHMPTSVAACVDKSSFLDGFESAYNYRKKSASVPLRFLAERASTTRRAASGIKPKDGSK